MRIFIFHLLNIYENIREFGKNSSISLFVYNFYIENSFEFIKHGGHFTSLPFSFLIAPFLRSEQVKHKEIYFYSVPEQFPVGGNCDYSPPPRETKISYTDTGDRIIRLFEPLIIRSF